MQPDTATTEVRKRTMLAYSPAPIQDTSAFVYVGTPEDLGAKTLEGTPEASVQVDFSAEGMRAGLFMATRGKVEFTFPYTEHATILEGEVILTDESGQTHTYRPGDSYFITQGQIIVWEVKSERMIKSFFNNADGTQT
jgi:uncharacterized cupin superfamily protein